ncbi:MAG: hypothetical protein ABL955_04465, partial [Elusimicrobiota bacterium]
DWSNARAYEKDNAKLRAEGKPPLPRPAGLPGLYESYSRFIVAARYDRVKEISRPTEQQMAELHETYFAMNRAAYIALGCDQSKLPAAENASEGTAARVFHRGVALVESATAVRVPSDTVPGTEEQLAEPVVEEPSSAPAEEAAPEKFDRKKTAAFCAGFLANARRPTTYNQIQFNAQKKLADDIKAFLNDNDLARASTKSAKATEAMLRNMRAMTPELKAEYARRGVDIDGILRRNDQAQELQWAAVVRQLNTAGDEAGWQAYRDSLILRMHGDQTALATKVQADKLRAAASSGDVAGLTASLGDIQNPKLLTSGYLRAHSPLRARPCPDLHVERRREEGGDPAGV